MLVKPLVRLLDYMAMLAVGGFEEIGDQWYKCKAKQEDPQLDHYTIRTFEDPRPFKIISAHFSAIATVGACKWAPSTHGNIEESAILKPCMP